MARLTVGGYWSARQEDNTACAQRLALFLQGVAKCSSLLEDWYRGSPKKLRRIDQTVSSLAVLLERSNLRHKGKIAEHLRGSLGFTIGAWNGNNNDGQDASIMVSCGSFSSLLPNAIVFKAPEVFEAFNDDGIGHGPLRCVLESLIASWAPDYAAVFDVEKKKGPEPFLDLLLYVSKKIATPERVVLRTDVHISAFGEGTSNEGTLYELVGGGA